jgi:hypothetical protein
MDLFDVVLSAMIEWDPEYIIQAAGMNIYLHVTETIAHSKYRMKSRGHVALVVQEVMQYYYDTPQLDANDGKYPLSRCLPMADKIWKAIELEKVQRQVPPTVKE